MQTLLAAVLKESIAYFEAHPQELQQLIEGLVQLALSKLPKKA